MPSWPHGIGLSEHMNGYYINSGIMIILRLDSGLRAGQNRANTLPKTYQCTIFTATNTL